MNKISFWPTSAIVTWATNINAKITIILSLIIHSKEIIKIMWCDPGIIPSSYIPLSIFPPYPTLRVLCPFVAHSKSISLALGQGTWSQKVLHRRSGSTPKQCATERCPNLLFQKYYTIWIDLHTKRTPSYLHIAIALLKIIILFRKHVQLSDIFHL